jgi:hypothetical protein
MMGLAFIFMRRPGAGGGGGGGYLGLDSTLLAPNSNTGVAPAGQVGGPTLVSSGGASTGLFGAPAPVHAPAPITLGVLQGEGDRAQLNNAGALALHARHDAL